MIKDKNNMKNWNVLRPLLREKFGKNFSFYNDMNIGCRRIKIMGLNDKLKELELMGVDVKLYYSVPGYGGGYDCLVIKCDK